MGDFGAMISVELRKRGMSMSALSRALPYDKGNLSRVIRNEQPPSLTLAQALDRYFATSVFAVAVEDERAARLAEAEAAPSRMDAAAVASLAAVLDSFRHLDDVLGSAAMAPTTAGQLRQVAHLAREVRGPARGAFMTCAAGWGIFGGWVESATGRHQAAEDHLRNALEWSAEAKEPTLASVAYSFTAYSRGLRGRHVEAAALAEVAAAVEGAHPAQFAYARLQEARERAALGERSAARRLLDAGAAAVDAAESAGDPPGPIYWNRRPFFEIHAGRTLVMLGDFGDAADRIAAGLAALPEGQAGAEWTRKYAASLAEARAAA